MLKTHKIINNFISSKLCSLVASKCVSFQGFRASSYTGTHGESLFLENMVDLAISKFQKEIKHSKWKTDCSVVAVERNRGAREKKKGLAKRAVYSRSLIE